MRYKIFRCFLGGRKRFIKYVPTLELAQEHCCNPETSSKTCTSAAGKRRTRRCGPWFDAYTEVR